MSSCSPSINEPFEDYDPEIRYPEHHKLWLMIYHHARVWPSLSADDLTRAQMRITTQALLMAKEVDERLAENEVDEYAAVTEAMEER